MLRLAWSLCLPALASVAFAQPIDRTLVKPGLVHRTTADGPATRAASELVSFPALNLIGDERSHPRVGGGSHRWQGTLNIVQAGRYRFDVTLLGTVVVKLGDQVLASGRVPDGAARTIDGVEIELTAGIQPLSIALSTPTTGGSRFELIWRGPGFQAEPIPYFFYGHLPTDGIDDVKAESVRDRGRYLVEEHGCVNCHRETKPTLTPRLGNNLTKIAARTNAGWLDAWLKNPHELRPGTNMPALFAETDAGAAERYAVVAYLITLGDEREPRTVRGDEMKRSVEAGGKLYRTVGCSTCHGDKVTTAPTKAKKDDDEDDKPALAPHEQAYSLGDVDAGRFHLLGAVGSKWAVEPLAKYLLDPQTLNLHGRMPGMNLTPDEARDLARFLTRQTDEKLSAAMPAEPKGKPSDFGGATWKAAGKAVFTAKGCVNCHVVEGTDAPQPKFAKPLAALTEVGGCFSGKPNAAKTPAYRFTDADRAAVSAFLKVGTADDGPSPMYAAKASLKRFGCLNCHNKDGEGGLSEDLEKIMKSLASAENGEDIAPPRLTHAGHKLRSSWLRGVLVNGQRARAWMALRMPQYGENKVGRLVDGLPKLEGTTEDDTVVKPTYTVATIEAGRKLTGKDGMGCIACHDISGIAGGGTRGPDLAKTQDRVRRDWFSRWMHQPQRLAPGTKMPQNFLDGKSLFPAVLDCDADKQIEALWAYYSLGAGLPLPTGLEPPKGLIVTVGAKAELLRTFLPDNAGTRPIAVGFPGGINAVFDSASCRLTYAWAGNFLDATPVWNNRGGGQAKLLGPKFWTGPAGFPWAVAPDGVVPNFAKQFDDPAYGHSLKDDSYGAGPRYVRFSSFETDAAGNPSFAYRLTMPNNGPRLDLTEKLEALPPSLAPGLRRTFTVRTSQDGAVWFHVGKSAKEPRLLRADGKPAKGEHGEVRAAGTRAILAEVGDRITVVDAVTVPEGAEWHTADGALLLRLPPSAKPATIVLKLWGLPKDEPTLLEGLK